MLHVFIINVNAGKKTSFLIGKTINEHCENICINYSINYVYEKEDTYKVIERFKKYKDVVVYSVGGDGTLNQIINSIANIKLSIIPAGTGNDFQFTICNEVINISKDEIKIKHFLKENKII